MAYRINVTETAGANAATYTPTAGTHIADDLLLFGLTQDAGTVNISFGNTTATLTAASDLVTYAGSDIFADGDQIEITTSGNLTGTNLAIQTRYWVRDLTAGSNTFKLAATSGGAAIDITGAGSGTHTFHLMVVAATGWNMVGVQAASQGARMAFAYKIATAPGTTIPAFYGTTDDWIGTCIVYRHADLTTPIEAWMRSDWGNSTNISTAASNTVAASSAGGTTVITPSADSLLVYSWCSDSSQIAMRTKLADAIADSKRSATTNESVSHIICHNQLATAACPDITMYCAIATEGGNGWVLSIKNKSGGELQKQARVTAAENTGISNWFGNFGAVHGAVTWAKASTFVAAAGGAQTITINGTAITVSDVALGTVATTDLQNESLWGTLSYIPHATDATVIAGANWVLPAPENLSGKIVTFNYELNTSAINGRVGTEGMICGFGSSDNNFSVFQLRAKVQGWAISQAFAAFIDLGNSTVLATGSGGGCDFTAVDRFMIGWHRATGTGSVSIGIKNMSVLTSAVITGGGANDPANFKVLADDLSSWAHYRWADLQGLTQVLGKFNVQIGNGSHATYFDSAPAFEFARAYSSKSREWNVNASRVSLDIYAKSGDTINLAAGIVATETAQAVTINASSATTGISVAGQAFKGLSGFTDNAGVTLTGPTYKECGTVSLKANMTSMSVSKTVGAVPAVAMTANSKTLSGCTTDVTGTSATYHLETAVAVTALSLVDHTFTGTAATNKVHVLATTGTVIITISGTTVLDVGSVTSAGATVQVDAPVVTADISITGMPTAGTDIWLQIINTTAVSAASRANSTAYSAGDIRLRQTGIGTEQTAGLYLRCTTSGVSAGTPPTWNTTVGGTTTDGTVVWTTYAVLYFHADPASATLTDTYIDGEEFLAGETVDIRFAEMNAGTSLKRYSTTVLAETTGFSALVTEEADDVYATNALDGSAYETTFSPDFTNDYMVLDTNTDFAGKAAYAYFCYTLTTDAGMWNFWGGVTALDVGNYRINTAILDLYFDESAGFVKQTDDVRIFRDDGTRPAIDPTTGGHGIEINWRTPVSVVTTGGSALTAPESAQLMALPSATEIATEVVTGITF